MSSPQRRRLAQHFLMEHCTQVSFVSYPYFTMNTYLILLRRTKWSIVSPSSMDNTCRFHAPSSFGFSTCSKSCSVTFGIIASRTTPAVWIMLRMAPNRSCISSRTRWRVSLFEASTWKYSTLEDAEGIVESSLITCQTSYQ